MNLAGHDPVGHDSVVEGRNGRLFLRAAGDLDVMYFFTGSEAVEDDVSREWIRVLNQRTRRMRELGVHCLTLIVPEAHLVYSDHLPADMGVQVRSTLSRIHQGLDNHTRPTVIHPLRELVAGREQKEPFALTGSVWTDWGAWLGYRASMAALKAIRADEVDEGDVMWSEQDSSGDLGEVVSPERLSTVPVATVRGARSSTSVQLNTDTGESFLVLEREEDDLPAAIVFGDAFMTASVKFFAESFRRTAFVSTSTGAIQDDLLRWERPDVVIQVVGERQLATLPTEPTSDDFRAIFGDLLLDDPRATADQRTSRVLARAGRVEEARLASDAVLNRVPATARLMLHRAHLHAKSGQVEAALEALRHASTLDPSDAAPWSHKGIVLQMVGRTDEAKAAFIRAARIEPHLINHWQLAVRSCLATGDVEGAQELVKEAIGHHEHDPRTSEWMKWAQASIKDGTDETRLDDEARAAHLAGLVTKAVEQAKAQQWSAAKDTLTELDELVPGHPLVAQYLAAARQAVERTQ